jgi:ABC-type antimicrobial peptide transport system permease subunit
MSGTQHNDPISVHNAPPSNVAAYFLATSPDWLEAMKIPLLNGRRFRMNDANPQSAIVNQTFARQFFGGENVVGQRFKTAGSKTDYEIVGVAGDAGYRGIREPMLPVVYVPFRSIDKNGALEVIDSGTILVRTRDETPAALESILRQEVHKAQAQFRVSNIRTQQEILDAQTIRERLLAMLGMFFAGVALLLAAIGLYGVLNYSVLQRRREIGIRLAVGAQRGAIVRIVTAEVFVAVLAGVVVGAGIGLGTARYIEALFYHVKTSDVVMLAIPSGAVFLVALFAMLPGVSRAMRIDPAETLRSE